jgi:hypothetical protein
MQQQENKGKKRRKNKKKEEEWHSTWLNMNIKYLKTDLLAILCFSANSTSD